MALREVMRAWARYNTEESQEQARTRSVEGTSKVDGSGFGPEDILAELQGRRPQVRGMGHSPERDGICARQACQLDPTLFTKCLCSALSGRCPHRTADCAQGCDEGMKQTMDNLLGGLPGEGVLGVMGRRSAHDRPEIAHSSPQSGQHVEGRREPRGCLGELQAQQAWFRGTTKLEQHQGGNPTKG